MEEVDPAFAHDNEQRPKPTNIELDHGIPLIDLSILNSPDHTSDPDHEHDLARLVSEIGDACEKWGFFQVINHGVPPECREKLESAARKFFALPKEEKLKVKRDEKYTMGYYDAEHTCNVRDWKEAFDVGYPTATFPASACEELDDQHELAELGLLREWPQNPPELREACEEYGREVEKLAFKLLELIALSLGLPKHRLTGFVEDHASVLRHLYYPPCPSPDLALGCGPHKDAGVLSILAQDDVGGLEVLSKIDGEWIHVKPTPNAYVINLADIIEVWSNNKYDSVQHRVRANGDKERFSVPFFFCPSRQTWIEPLEELINEQNPRKYKGYNWGKFVASRRHGNFKKLNGESIHIHHFKIK